MSTKSLVLLPIILLGLCLQPAASEPQSALPAEYRHPQQLVSIEGTRRLNLVCIGSGTPAVIFLYGLGSGSFDWRKVQPAIGKVTKACTYDRAGYGFSDPLKNAADATNAISDLHALLHAGGLSRPVILVGHSLGGLYATLYAETYPKDVAGMVLVDPAFSGQNRAIADAIGPKAAHKFAASAEKTELEVNQCIALAKQGRLSDPAEAKSDCLDNPPDPDPALHEEKNRELKTAAYEIALGSEFHNASILDAHQTTKDDLETERAGASLGSMPLVVLTRGDSEMMAGLTAEEQSHADAAWKAGHDHVASLAVDGTNIVVPHAKHYIQLDQPTTVIEQINGIIGKVRAGR